MLALENKENYDRTTKTLPQTLSRRHTNSSGADHLHCCIQNKALKISEIFVFVPDIFWGLKKKKLATDNSIMPHQINPPRLIWGLLDVPHGAGCFSFQASPFSGKQMPPRALPHAWSFQSQPTWIPHIFQSLLLANRGVELIPSNLSHKQHSRWQVQHCRPVIKEHPVGLHVLVSEEPRHLS